jgi:hypothetical protein
MNATEFRRLVVQIGQRQRQLLTNSSILISDAHVFFCMLCQNLSDELAVEQIELAFPQNTSKALLASMKLATPDENELLLVLQYASAQNLAAASRLVATGVIAERTKKIEAALVLTLAEPEPKKAWKRDICKLAIIFVLHCSPEPFVAVKHLLSGLIRSDERRLEGLHADWSEENESLSPVNLAQVIESIAFVSV